MAGIPIRFITLAILLEVSFATLSLISTTRDRIVEAVVLLLAAGCAYLFAVYFVVHQTAQSRHLVTFIIALAIAFRLTTWPLAAPTTDDVYRYRWEGKLQVHGGNPYQVRPNDMQWERLRDSAYPQVGQKEFKAGYGPAWEFVSATAYQIISGVVTDPVRQAFWFKVPAVAADLGIIAAIISLLRLKGLPPAWVLIYAWSPLPIWEFWANGHNDALTVLFLLLAMVAAEQSRWLMSYALLGVSIAFKIWPFLLLPAFVLRQGRLRDSFAAAAPIAVFALPYWSGVSENFRYMTGFIGGWRNNDSLFGLVYWLAGDLYRAKYIAIGLITIATMLIASRRWDLQKSVLWTVVSILLLSSNCHPWYLIWFLPLLVFYPVAGLLLWTVAMPLAYAVLIRWITEGTWEGSTSIRWFIYLPVFGVLMGSWLVHQVQNRYTYLRKEPI